MNKVLIKDLFKELIASKKRFISIILIVMLGVGFYAGIKVSTPAMKYTADKYFTGLNLMDFSLISTMGITEENLKKIEKVNEIDGIMPSYSADALAKADKQEFAVKIHSLPKDLNVADKNYINRLRLTGGKFPTTNKELITEKSFLERQKLKIGDKITLEVPIKEDEENFLKEKEFEIVGTVESPAYISIERGNTNLGNGTLATYVYVKEECINSEVYTEIYATVKNKEGKLTYDKPYEKHIKAIETKLNDLGKELNKDRYDEIIKKATDKLNDGKKKLSDAKIKKDEEIAKAQKEIDDATEKIKNGESDIDINEKKAKKEFANADDKIRKAQLEINKKEKEFLNIKNEAQAQFEIVKQNILKINDGITQVDAGLATAEKALKDLDEAIVKGNQILASLKANLATVDAAILQIPEGTTDPILIAQKEELVKQKITLETNIKQIESLPNQKLMLVAEIEKANQQKSTLINQKQTLENMLTEKTAELNNGEVKIKEGKNKLLKEKNNLANIKNTTNAKINTAKIELADAKVKLQEGRNKLETENKKANEEIDKAEKEIIDAEEKISEIKKPVWHTLDRSKNRGYEEYKQNAMKIDAIGKIFPVIFFIVAALICLTSMTRMVEEQRMQIGTMKALGYNKKQIAMKYIVYALLATIIGSFLGALVGMQLLPRVIAKAYSMMYTLPEVEIPINFEIPISASLIAVFCTVFATIYACRQELKYSPSELMRPKAPKMGRRVWVEKIHFIWNRLNFTQKVTARNIFRYKKKFFMTIIGIAGCTALVVTGFGIKDSVTALIPKQYDGIFKYNMQIGIKEKTTKKEMDELTNKLNEESSIKEYTKIKMLSSEIKSKNKLHDSNIIVAEDKNILEKQIKLQHRITNEKIKLGENSVVITEKLAKLLKVKPLDKIELELEDNVVVTAVVGDVTENYVGHYIYMSKEYYNKLSKEELKYNLINITLNKIPEKEKDILLTNILKNDIITGATSLDKVQSEIGKTFDSLNSIVWVLIIAAAALAFVVLYNLSNTNISERIRELATIKVLGFYDHEVSAYVHRESVLLTIIGTITGLVLGYFLETFVIKTCEVDMILFSADIKFISYVYAVLATVTCTWVVNIFTYFSLKKIDMIESLKSVE
ncbi:MAG: FtsX-like permease family protein [Clostridia bacterium]